jgi:hypothetical protein
MIKTLAKDFYDFLISGGSNFTLNEASAVSFYYKQPYAKEMPEYLY